jgi:hypothetical protein
VGTARNRPVRETPTAGAWWLAAPGIAAWLHALPALDPILPFLPLSESVFYAWLSNALFIGTLLAVCSAVCLVLAARRVRTRRAGSERCVLILAIVIDGTYVAWFGFISLAMMLEV